MNEFELIKRFTAAFQVPPAPAGPGDDCALVRVSGHTVVTTDAVVEGVHFTRRTFSPADVGHKALAVNLSDLAAMGATPTWFLCALGLPEDFDVTSLQAVARGMARLAAVHGITLVGGNVTRSLQLTVTITAAGTAPRPLLRSGARPGDLLYVSGPLGDAAAGLEVLRLGGPWEAQRDQLVAAQRRPSPHLTWARLAARHASAGLDVSDGLLQDLGHLCAASGVGASLSARQVPVSEALLAFAGSSDRALDFALRGGDDYVLLVSVPRARQGAFERALARAGLSAFRLGAVERKAGVRVDGSRVRGSTGFVHFR